MSDRTSHKTHQDRRDALTDLGVRLETALQPETVLALVVRTVAEACALPYAGFAVTNPDSGEDELVAEYRAVDASADGSHTGRIRFATSYRGEIVGALIVAMRESGVGFSGEELVLIRRVVANAAWAAFVVRMTVGLRRARERLVLAREEERRTLRHDLHDSIGPTLAALDLRAGALGRLISSDPAVAGEKLRELRQQIRDVITEIRRVVYNLRPPSLDELGLVSAIREQATQFTMEGLQVRVDAPDTLPQLPAGIEVAIYRIITEAMTNVARHAKARNCWVRLAPRDQDIVIEVTDDGTGIPDEHGIGVGTISMRERAHELDGVLEVFPRAGGGTVVRTLIPIDLSALRQRARPAPRAGARPE